MGIDLHFGINFDLMDDTINLSGSGLVISVKKPMALE